MNKLSIVEFFNNTNFNYKEIEESFLLYYIGYTLNIKNFLEIGTGRETTSY